MAYKYEHFIPENIAPRSANIIGVYDDNGKRVCTIPLGRMTPPKNGKLYSFGLVSDIHIGRIETSWNGEKKFDNALTFFEEEGCAFCVHCGDISQTGLYKEGDAVNVDTTQFAKYNEIVESHSISVYGICGNHESYVNPITNNLTELREYTGNELYYKIEHQNDIFIFCGQPSETIPMSDEAFAFLAETLSINRDKRCFVIVHPVWNDDSGDAEGVYSTHSGLGGTLLSSWDKGSDLKNLLKKYPKAILLHGHTHVKYEYQVNDKNLNYTNRNGFHSVHVSSLGRPRDIINNSLVYAPSESQGYIVDVYDDCIVLNGMDFINNIPVPLGVYKIKTT